MIFFNPLWTGWTIDNSRHLLRCGCALRQPISCSNRLAKRKGQAQTQKEFSTVVSPGAAFLGEGRSSFTEGIAGHCLSASRDVPQGRLLFQRARDLSGAQLSYKFFRIVFVFSCSPPLE